MGYRHCPDCEKWLSTSEYTVDESGETICPEEDHSAVHGFIIDPPWTRREFFSEHPSWYDDRGKMMDQARQQNLVQ